MTTKQYLRFSPDSVFGVIASSNANILPLSFYNQKDNFFAVPACENVYIWNLRTKEKHMVFKGEKSAVTCVASDSSYKILAVGYHDGTVRIFDLQKGVIIVSFIGHKTDVSCLTFDESGSNVASGGKDSEIVVWNVTDETGLFRLKGHKGPISKCLFLQNVLISSSKDTFIKLWDLETQHCFQTIVGNQREVLDMVLIKGTKLISGINGDVLKIWDLSLNKNEILDSHVSKKLKTNSAESDADSGTGDMEDESSNKFKVLEIGSIQTEENKTTSIVVNSTERLLGMHGSTKYLRLFKILNPGEISKKLRKKRNKEMKRKSAGDDGDDTEVETTVEDEFRALQPLQLPSKIDSFTLSVNDVDVATITILLKNNSVMQYRLDMKPKGSAAEVGRSITLPGHRSFVRTLSYSTDSMSVLSACDSAVKIWRNLQDEMKCCSTFECDSAECSVFVTGNSHCIIGTKKGKLEIFEIDTKALLESVNAHDGAVHCICVTPEQSGVTTGGSDKEVKFWDFELIRDETYSDTKKRLTLKLKKTLKMPEEVICIKYSPDNKRIAISLLDSTVQVLFTDSLKLAFSLYGHQFPVTCLDISHDSTLIITGSSDRTVRIWSMEFGSCNRRLKITDKKGTPTDKGITCLQFLPKSHLFFAAGKDHVVRQWDADNFQKITTLKGHQHEVTAMAVSPDGAFVVTSSKDRSIRTWGKTTEPLVLEEEKEIEAEENEKEIEDLPEVPGEVNKEVAFSGMKTVETIKAVDQLIEALDLYKTEMKVLEQHELDCEKAGKKLPPPPVHPLFMAYQTTMPIKYLLKVFRKIKASELEGALSLLPFNYVLDFFNVLSEFADRGWDVEFCMKCIKILVKHHMGQLSTTRNLRSVIENLRNKLFEQMYHVRDMIGFVKAGTDVLQREIDAREEVSLFSSILEDAKKKKKKGKRRLERPVVAFT